MLKGTLGCLSWDHRWVGGPWQCWKEAAGTRTADTQEIKFIERDVQTSTRTRCSFEVAAHDLGMGATYLDPTGSQIGKKESIADNTPLV